jgi:hypothetical protein
MNQLPVILQEDAQILRRMRANQQINKLTGDGVTWLNTGGQNIAKVQWPRQPRRVLRRPPRDGLIVVQNNSGANRMAGEILAVDVALITAAQNSNYFQFTPAITGVQPTSADIGNFVVCYKPIPSGATGLAFMCGYCTAWVDFQNVNDEFADIKAGDSTQLISNNLAGSAALASHPSSTGKQQILVVLGNFPFGQHCDVALSGPTGSVSTGYSYVVKDTNGNNVTNSFTGSSPFTPTYRMTTPSTLNLNGSATVGQGLVTPSGAFVLKFAEETWNFGDCT